jgi:hypothetical protein
MPDLLGTSTIVPFQERYLSDARARPRIGTIVPGPWRIGLDRPPEVEWLTSDCG